jgi:16S rRNA (cytidine1402-2'-O)-methyltransferase
MSAATAPTGKLYLVPNTLDLGTTATTEIPDIQDVLPQEVLRVAAGLEHWVAENAKSTRAYLQRVHAVLPLHRPLQAIQIVELPRPVKGQRDARPADLSALLAPAHEGADIGLISEAGLPAVADPGAALVQCAHAAGIEVVALSGPSSLMLALAASGLNGQSFAFVGYLPIDAAERAARVRELETLSRRGRQTQLVIETPYRNEALLEALLAHLQPGTRLSVSCGLTLTGGFSRTGTVSAWKAKGANLPKDRPAVFSFLAG